MTTLKVIEQISAAGTASVPNEDIAGHSTCGAWALDGATGLAEERLLPGASDAHWLVAQYDALLRDRADRIELAPHQLFTDCIDTVTRKFEAERSHVPETRFELPSAGIAFVRVAHQRLEYARLGDCRAIFALADGTIVSTRHSALQALDGRVIAKMEKLRQSDAALTYADVRAAVQNDLRANRNLLNAPGGYWALGTESEAARHMEAGAFPLYPDTRIRGLLVTDGFYRLVDTFGVFDDDAKLLAETFAQGLGPLLHKLRTLEDADPECIAYPRLKAKDDATALLFEAGATQ